MCSRRQRRPPTRIQPSRPQRPKPRPRTSSRTSSRTQHPCRPRRHRAFARALGVAQDPRHPRRPRGWPSTRGRSLSPVLLARGTSSRTGENGVAAVHAAPPRTDPPSPTSAGSPQAPAFCVDDDVTTPIKPAPPQPEVASPFDPARPRRPPTVECDDDGSAKRAGATRGARHADQTSRDEAAAGARRRRDSVRAATLGASGRDSEDASSAAKPLPTRGRAPRSRACARARGSVNIIISETRRALEDDAVSAPSDAVSAFESRGADRSRSR